MQNDRFISNPPKKTKVTFRPDDQLIVLAEELAVID